MIKRWIAFYGAHPLQLLLLLAALALAGYAGLGVLRNPEWLRILVWFAAAIVAHDLVLFPLYAAADGLLVRAVSRWGLVNYVRTPLLACALTFVLFLPGIIRQGKVTYVAATGLTQQPFLARWLVLCVIFFVVSGLVFGLRAAVRGVLHRTESG
jgi:hypothetical protein